MILFIIISVLLVRIGFDAYLIQFLFYIPNVSSNIMPAFVIFCATTILLTISGIRSAGGLICIRYFCCSPSKFLHCLKNKKGQLISEIKFKIKQ